MYNNGGASVMVTAHKKSMSMGCLREMCMQVPGLLQEEDTVRFHEFTYEVLLVLHANTIHVPYKETEGRNAACMSAERSTLCEGIHAGGRPDPGDGLTAPCP